MKYSQYFDRRKNTFEKSHQLILDAIENDKEYNIVELGSSRSYVNGDYPGLCNSNDIFWKSDKPHMWDWGAGIFTKVFSDNLEGKNYKLYTIDPNEDANKIVSTMCRDNNKVIVKSGYSTDFLRTIDFKIDFLYMDHMESSEEASLKHLEDCKLIVEKDLMSKNAIILIDDVGENMYHTKGKYSIPFLSENNYKIIIQEYQVLMQRQ